MMVVRAGRDVNGTKLVIVLVLAALSLAASLVYRAHQTAQTDRKLCNVLRGRIASSSATFGQKGAPFFAYFQEHPDELRAARAQNREWLKALDCDHLPSGG